MATEMRTLWDIFKAVSADLKAGNIICIIDALDECEDITRKQLVKWFVDLIFEKSKSISLSRFFLKVLMTSRPYQTIEKDFCRVPNVSNSRASVATYLYRLP